MTGKTILSLMVDNLCLELEALREPRLKNRPFVLATPGNRSIVQAVSSVASGCGVSPGMPLGIAKKRCRSLMAVPPDTSFYHRFQKKIYHELKTFSPFVEIHGWGKYYLDLTGTKRLWGDPVDAAYRAQQVIKKLINLDARAGIGTNKLVSQVAASLVPPLDICEVFPGSEGRFMAPLNPQALPGIGPVTQKRLQELNITSLGKLAAIPPEILKATLGHPAQYLRNLARGRGETRVNNPNSVPGIHINWPLPEETNNREVLLSHLMVLGEKLGYRLRKENRIPYNISLEIVYSDGARSHGQKTVTDAILYLDHFIFSTLKEILARICKRRVRVKEIIVKARKFSIPYRQLSLFAWDEMLYEREEKLTRALDSIRTRFGFDSIRRGNTLDIRPGMLN